MVLQALSKAGGEEFGLNKSRRTQRERAINMKRTGRKVNNRGWGEKEELNLNKHKTRLGYGGEFYSSIHRNVVSCWRLDGNCPELEWFCSMICFGSAREATKFTAVHYPFNAVFWNVPGREVERKFSV